MSKGSRSSEHASILALISSRVPPRPAQVEGKEFKQTDLGIDVGVAVEVDEEDTCEGMLVV